MNSVLTPTEAEQTLPDKPSDLLELSLKDLIRAERRKHVKIDMSTYHYPRSAHSQTGSCYVCLAGAMMIGSLNTSIDFQAGTGDWGIQVQHKLYAIDAFREGYLAQGCEWMGAEITCEFEETTLPRVVTIPDYSNNRSGFKRGIRKIIRALREKGL